MGHPRNTEGIRAAAQRKRDSALERTDAAIRSLVKQGLAINFTTVAKTAQVSTAWLYEEPEIKARIQQLRDQGTPKAKSYEVKPRSSDASKDAIIATLKGRIKILEQRNRDLSQQNEVFGGQVVRVRELEQQSKRFQAEILALRQSIGNSKNLKLPSTNPTQLEAEVEKLGVQLNSTIQQTLLMAPLSIIEDAMKSLKEAIIEDRVENPSGFFYRAVTAAWRPNELFEHKAEQDVFNQWFPLAHQAGLVQAATQMEGVQYVLANGDKWTPFSELINKYPLESLKNADLKGSPSLGKKIH